VTQAYPITEFVCEIGLSCIWLLCKCHKLFEPVLHLQTILCSPKVIEHFDKGHVIYHSLTTYSSILLLMEKKSSRA